MKTRLALENQTGLGRNLSDSASKNPIVDSLEQSLKAHLTHPTTLQEQSAAPHVPWATGVDEIDACLPDCGLSRSGLHEIEPLTPTDMPSLSGFAFGLLSKLRSHQTIIWCVTAQQVGDYGHLYAFGLERYGISPAQIVITKVNYPLHLHFALEEALKTDGIAAVIGEGPRPTFTGSRRLSLLCQTHARPCVLLNAKTSGSQTDGPHGSAALTRWQIAPTQGVEDPLDPFGPGLPTWRIALPRARGGRTMPDMRETRRGPDMRETPEQFGTPNQHNNNTSYPWRIAWDEQTLSFRKASLFSSGTVSQDPDTIGKSRSRLVGRTG